MASDLFRHLDSLWTKEAVEDTPPIYVMHRFLASERLFAPVARELQQKVRDARITAQVWRGILPRGRAAPRLAYAAPKKVRLEDNALVEAIVSHEHVRREVAEDMVELIGLQDGLATARAFYGLADNG